MKGVGTHYRSRSQVPIPPHAAPATASTLDLMSNIMVKHMEVQVLPPRTGGTNTPSRRRSTTVSPVLSKTVSRVPTPDLISQAAALSESSFAAASSSVAAPAVQPELSPTSLLQSSLAATLSARSSPSSSPSPPPANHFLAPQVPHSRHRKTQSISVTMPRQTQSIYVPSPVNNPSATAGAGLFLTGSAAGTTPVASPLSSPVRQSIAEQEAKVAEEEAAREAASNFLSRQQVISLERESPNNFEQLYTQTVYHDGDTDSDVSDLADDEQVSFHQGSGASGSAFTSSATAVAAQAAMKNLREKAKAKGTTSSSPLKTPVAPPEVHLTPADKERIRLKLGGSLGFVDDQPAQAVGTQPQTKATTAATTPSYKVVTDADGISHFATTSRPNNNNKASDGTEANHTFLTGVDDQLVLNRQGDDMAGVEDDFELDKRFAKRPAAHPSRSNRRSTSSPKLGPLATAGHADEASGDDATEQRQRTSVSPAGTSKSFFGKIHPLVSTDDTTAGASAGGGGTSPNKAIIVARDSGSEDDENDEEKGEQLAVEALREAQNTDDNKSDDSTMLRPNERRKKRLSKAQKREAKLTQLTSTRRSVLVAQEKQREEQEAAAAEAEAQRKAKEPTIPSKWFELTSFGSGYVSGTRLRNQIKTLQDRQDYFLKELRTEEGAQLITEEITNHAWFYVPRTQAVNVNAPEEKEMSRVRAVFRDREIAKNDIEIGFVPSSTDDAQTVANKRAEAQDRHIMLKRVESQREWIKQLDQQGKVKFLVDPPPEVEDVPKKKKDKKKVNVSNTSQSLVKTLNLMQQGDLNMYTIHHLLDREILKFHVDVLVAVREWWHTATKLGPPRDHLIGKAEYFNIMRLLYYVLVDCEVAMPSKQQSDGQATPVANTSMLTGRKLSAEQLADLERRRQEFEQIMEQDWQIDTDGGASDALNFAQFHRALHQLTDHWTFTLEGSEYAYFLRTLLTIVTEAEEDEYGHLHRTWRTMPFSFDLSDLGYERKFSAGEADPEWLKDLADWSSDDEQELGEYLKDELDTIEKAEIEEQENFPSLEDVAKALREAGIDLSQATVLEKTKVSEAVAEQVGLGSMEEDGLVRDAQGTIIGRRGENEVDILNIEGDEIIGSVATNRQEIERELQRAVEIHSGASSPHDDAQKRSIVDRVKKILAENLLTPEEAELERMQQVQAIAEVAKKRSLPKGKAILASMREKGLIGVKRKEREAQIEAEAQAAADAAKKAAEEDGRRQADDLIAGRTKVVRTKDGSMILLKLRSKVADSIATLRDKAQTVTAMKKRMTVTLPSNSPIGSPVSEAQQRSSDAFKKRLKILAENAVRAREDNKTDEEDDSPDARAKRRLARKSEQPDVLSASGGHSSPFLNSQKAIKARKEAEQALEREREETRVALEIQAAREKEAKLERQKAEAAAKAQKLDDIIRKLTKSVRNLESDGEKDARLLLEKQLEEERLARKQEEAKARRNSLRRSSFSGNDWDRGFNRSKELSDNSLSPDRSNRRGSLSRRKSGNSLDSNDGAHQRTASYEANQSRIQSVVDPVTGRVLRRRRRSSSAKSKEPREAADGSDDDYDYEDDQGNWGRGTKNGAISAFKSHTNRTLQSNSQTSSSALLDPKINSAFNVDKDSSPGKWRGGDRFKDMYRMLYGEAGGNYQSSSLSNNGTSFSPYSPSGRRRSMHRGGEDSPSYAQGGMSRSSSKGSLHSGAENEPMYTQDAFETEVEKLQRIRRERAKLALERQERENAWKNKLALIRKRKEALERGSVYVATAEELAAEKKFKNRRRSKLKAEVVSSSRNVSSSSDDEDDEHEVDFVNSVPESLPETSDERKLREDEEALQAQLAEHVRREEAKERLRFYLEQQAELQREVEAREKETEELRKNIAQAALDSPKDLFLEAKQFHEEYPELPNPNPVIVIDRVDTPPEQTSPVLTTGSKHSRTGSTLSEASLTSSPTESQQHSPSLGPVKLSAAERVAQIEAARAERIRNRMKNTTPLYVPRTSRVFKRAVKKEAVILNRYDEEEEERKRVEARNLALLKLQLKAAAALKAKNAKALARANLLAARQGRPPVIPLGPGGVGVIPTAIAPNFNTFSLNSFQLSLDPSMARGGPPSHRASVFGTRAVVSHVQQLQQAAMQAEKEEAERKAYMAAHPEEFEALTPRPKRASLGEQLSPLVTKISPSNSVTQLSPPPDSFNSPVGSHANVKIGGDLTSAAVGSSGGLRGGKHRRAPSKQSVFSPPKASIKHSFPTVNEKHAQGESETLPPPQLGDGIPNAAAAAGTLPIQGPALPMRKRAQPLNGPAVDVKSVAAVRAQIASDPNAARPITAPESSSDMSRGQTPSLPTSPSMLARSPPISPLGARAFEGGSPRLRPSGRRTSSVTDSPLSLDRKSSLSHRSSIERKSSTGSKGSVRSRHSLRQSKSSRKSMEEDDAPVSVDDSRFDLSRSASESDSSLSEEDSDADSDEEDTKPKKKRSYSIDHNSDEEAKAEEKTPEPAVDSAEQTKADAAAKAKQEFEERRAALRRQATQMQSDEAAKLAAALQEKIRLGIEEAKVASSPPISAVAVIPNSPTAQPLDATTAAAIAVTSSETDLDHHHHQQQQQQQQNARTPSPAFRMPTPTEIDDLPMSEEAQEALEQMRLDAEAVKRAEEEEKERLIQFEVAQKAHEELLAAAAIAHAAREQAEKEAAIEAARLAVIEAEEEKKRIAFQRDEEERMALEQFYIERAQAEAERNERKREAEERQRKAKEDAAGRAVEFKKQHEEAMEKMRLKREEAEEAERVERQAVEAARAATPVMQRSRAPSISVAGKSSRASPSVKGSATSSPALAPTLVFNIVPPTPPKSRTPLKSITPNEPLELDEDSKQSDDEALRTALAHAVEAAKAAKAARKQEKKEAALAAATAAAESGADVSTPAVSVTLLDSSSDDSDDDSSDESDSEDDFESAIPATIPESHPPAAGSVRSATSTGMRPSDLPIKFRAGRRPSESGVDITPWSTGEPLSAGATLGSSRSAHGSATVSPHSQTGLPPFVPGTRTRGKHGHGHVPFVPRKSFLAQGPQLPPRSKSGKDSKGRRAQDDLAQGTDRRPRESARAGDQKPISRSTNASRRHSGVNSALGQFSEFPETAASAGDSASGTDVKVSRQNSASSSHSGESSSAALSHQSSVRSLESATPPTTISIQKSPSPPTEYYITPTVRNTTANMNIIITSSDEQSEPYYDESLISPRGSEISASGPHDRQLPAPIVVPAGSPPIVESSDTWTTPEQTPTEETEEAAPKPFIIIPTKYKSTTSPALGPKPPSPQATSGSTSPHTERAKSLSSQAEAEPSVPTVDDWLRGFTADHPSENAIFAGKIDDKKEEAKPVEPVKEDKLDDKALSVDEPSADASAASDAATTAPSIAVDAASTSEEQATSPTHGRKGSLVRSSSVARTLGSFAPIVGANRSSIRFSMPQPSPIDNNGTDSPVASDAVDGDPESTSQFALNIAADKQAALEANKQLRESEALTKDIQRLLHKNLAPSAANTRRLGFQKVAKGNVISSKASSSMLEKATFQSHHSSSAQSLNLAMADENVVSPLHSPALSRVGSLMPEEAPSLRRGSSIHRSSRATLPTDFAAHIHQPSIQEHAVRAEQQPDHSHDRGEIVQAEAAVVDQHSQQSSNEVALEETLGPNEAASSHFASEPVEAPPASDVDSMLPLSDSEDKQELMRRSSAAKFRFGRRSSLPTNATVTPGTIPGAHYPGTDTQQHVADKAPTDTIPQVSHQEHRRGLSWAEVREKITSKRASLQMFGRVQIDTPLVDQVEELGEQKVEQVLGEVVNATPITIPQHARKRSEYTTHNEFESILAQSAALLEAPTPAPPAPTPPADAPFGAGPYVSHGYLRPARVLTTLRRTDESPAKEATVSATSPHQKHWNNPFEIAKSPSQSSLTKERDGSNKRPMKLRLQSKPSLPTAVEEMSPTASVDGGEPAASASDGEMSDSSPLGFRPSRVKPHSFDPFAASEPNSPLLISSKRLGVGKQKTTRGRSRSKSKSKSPVRRVVVGPSGIDRSKPKVKAPYAQIRARLSALGSVDEQTHNSASIAAVSSAPTVESAANSVTNLHQPDKRDLHEEKQESSFTDDEGVFSSEGEADDTVSPFKPQFGWKEYSTHSDSESAPATGPAPRSKPVPRIRRDYSIYSHPQAAEPGSLLDAVASKLSAKEPQQTISSVTANPQLLAHSPATSSSSLHSSGSSSLFLGAPRSNPSRSDYAPAVQHTFLEFEEKHEPISDRFPPIPAPADKSVGGLFPNQTSDGVTPLARVLHPSSNEPISAQTARAPSRSLQQQPQPLSARLSYEGRPTVPSASPPLRPHPAFSSSIPAGAAPLLPTPPATPANLMSSYTSAVYSKLSTRKPPAITIVQPQRYAFTPLKEKEAAIQMEKAARAAAAAQQSTPRYTFQLPSSKKVPAIL